MSPSTPPRRSTRAVNGGYSYSWLQIECSRCKAARDVDLAALTHRSATFVHDLGQPLAMLDVRKANRRPAATLLQLAWQNLKP